MGKFDGILLCSDFDGTFYSGSIPENNIEAVKYFMSEGGHFTFCTGRRGDIFKKICNDFKPNVPLIGMGGGQIYDIDRDISLKQVFFDDKIIPLLRDFMKMKGVRTARVDFTDHSEYFMPDDTTIFKDYWTKEITPLDRTPLSKMVFEEEPPIYKAVVYFDYMNEDPVPEEVRKLCEGRANPTANAFGYAEIMPFGFDKGTTALELKKITGDKILIGIGDFTGDLPLLKAADIGYAVENALPEVKAAADRITVNVKNGALAALIDEISVPENLNLSSVSQMGNN